MTAAGPYNSIDCLRTQLCLFYYICLCNPVFFILCTPRLQNLWHSSNTAYNHLYKFIWFGRRNWPAVHNWWLTLQMLEYPHDVLMSIWYLIFVNRLSLRNGFQPLQFVGKSRFRALLLFLPCAFVDNRLLAGARLLLTLFLFVLFLLVVLVLFVLLFLLVLLVLLLLLFLFVVLFLIVVLFLFLFCWLFPLRATKKG